MQVAQRRFFGAGLVAAALALSAPAAAVAVLGHQVAPNQWSYDLTYAALDNYSIFQPTTTITLTGLSGVTAATGPTSTDFAAAPLNAINLAWSAEVLNGGTAVRWTHLGPGTGNFSIDKHVFGFNIFAEHAIDGIVAYATDGFSRDTNLALPNGSFDLDISSSVAGPVAAPAVVPEPPGLCLMLGALAGLAGTLRRHRRYALHAHERGSRPAG